MPFDLIYFNEGRDSMKRRIITVVFLVFALLLPCKAATQEFYTSTPEASPSTEESSSPPTITALPSNTETYPETTSDPNPNTNQNQMNIDQFIIQEESQDQAPTSSDKDSSFNILELKLPVFDTQSNEAKKFITDMKSVLGKAVRLSGINSTYGVFIMDLSSRLYYGENEHLTRIDDTDNMKEGYFNSASVVKLFQGYILCDMMRRSELDTNKTYRDDITGRSFKLLPMIEAMISYSDNDYSNACLRLIGNHKSNDVLARLGITNSRIYGEMSGAVGYSRQNNIKKYGTAKRCARLTPYDTALILYNIYIEKDTDIYMKTLNKALLGNIYNTRIPVGVKRVSKKYAVAHKTGTNDDIGVYNDAGIVYTKRPFILVAFTQGTTSKAAHVFIRSLAEQLTRYFEK